MRTLRRTIAFIGRADIAASLAILLICLVVWLVL
jgi:hypothetical protein